MDELAYRMRAAEPGDEPQLKQAIGITMARPDGKRTAYRAAAQRGEVLVLEQYDTREHRWNIVGFVEYHVRVDDTVTIKDAGSIGETPHSAIIKHLFNEALGSAGAREATAKVRSDATAWNELLGSIPGFYQEGKEYSRPHYYLIWRWSPELAAQQARRKQRGRRV
ncbi:MAG: hypothetical protein HY690_03730 [Chloroflexi bacterium]|nr:hypothetical protein [Chloroflexota bacterium]